MHYPQYLHTRAAEFLVTHTILHPVARARRAPRPVRSPRQSPVLDLSPVVFHASTTVAVQVSNTTDRQRCSPPPAVCRLCKGLTMGISQRGEQLRSG